MATVTCTKALQRHVGAPTCAVDGSTVRAALESYFRRYPAARSYVVDEQGALRKHITVFVNGTQISDRTTMSDPLGADDEVYVMQALSGG